MLSSQTKDEVTAKAMIELKKFPLEIDVMLATDQEKISKAIYPVSFYKVLKKRKHFISAYIFWSIKLP